MYYLTWSYWSSALWLPWPAMRLRPQHYLHVSHTSPCAVQGPSLCCALRFHPPFVPFCPVALYYILIYSHICFCLTSIFQQLCSLLYILVVDSLKYTIQFPPVLSLSLVFVSTTALLSCSPSHLISIIVLVSIVILAFDPCLCTLLLSSHYTGERGTYPADTLWFHCDFLNNVPRSIQQIHAEFFQKVPINSITM